MSLRNTREGWGWLAKAFHWSMAVLIVGMAVVGTYMANFLDDMILQIELTQTHKSFGFVVFALAVLRVLWRWANPTPSLPADQPRIERIAAHVSHYGLYLLMFVMPLSGWLMASASPLNDENAYPVQIRNMVFGLFELPDPIQPSDRDLESLFHAIHAYGSYLLAFLLLMHVAGALKHHFIDRDGIFRRMLPW